MLGAIVGDVLGSIHEHNPIKTKNFELLNANCVFTDDTVMTVAVADSLMNGTPYVESLQMWGSSYPSAGYGCWFNEWIYSDSPEPYNSFGNGSAMRSSSVGWLFDDDTSVFKEAEKSAVITHNHPEGIKGAQAVALGVFLGRTGNTKNKIRDNFSNQYSLFSEGVVHLLHPLCLCQKQPFTKITVLYFGSTISGVPSRSF